MKISIELQWPGITAFASLCLFVAAVFHGDYLFSVPFIALPVLDCLKIETIKD